MALMKSYALPARAGQAGLFSILNESTPAEAEEAEALDEESAETDALGGDPDGGTGTPREDEL